MEGEVDCFGEDTNCPSHFLVCLGACCGQGAHHPAWQGPGTQLSAPGVAGGASSLSPLASALREPRALVEGCFSYDVILIVVQMSLDPTITRLSCW